MKKISELTGISGTVQNENILVINTAGGTKKITYGQLCAAVKATLGIRNVAEGIEITEPEMLMDGKIASEKFMELDEAITQLNGDMLKHDTSPKIESVTINPSGYTRIDVPDKNKNYLFATVPNWFNNTGAFAIHGSGNVFYVVGTPGIVVNGLNVRFWYK